MNRMQYLELKQFADQLVANPSKVKLSISYALSIVLAQTAVLPTSEVEDAQSFYASNVAVSVLQRAAAFNEEIVVDIDLVEQVTRAYWYTRYYSAYPTHPIPILGDDGPALLKLVGASHYLDPKTLEFFGTDIEKTISLINKVRDTLEV